MKFVALVSGGKDSIYSILECQRLGHELVACVHLGAAENNNNNMEEESYMYQTAASETITTLVEECIGVSLIFYQRTGTSINTSLVYQQVTVGDEVEDLYQALKLAQDTFPQVQAVSSGAILSTYQRVRIEHVCSRLGLVSLSYLWRAAPQHDLLDKMIRDGITAVLVRAACPPGLKPHKHLNKTLEELQPLFLHLNQLYQFHVCGEGGEYESLVIDCPLYKRRLVLDEVEVIELEGDEGVGVLKVKKCHAVDKTEAPDSSIVAGVEQPATTTTTTNSVAPLVDISRAGNSLPMSLAVRYLPKAKFVGGGLWHTSELMVPVLPNLSMLESLTEAELAVQEAKVVLEILGILLEQHGCTAQDVLSVHLYLSEISHFFSINSHYREFFGTLLPPSRSCVAVGRHVLPGGRRVSLDCMVQCGSGAYLRAQRGQSSYADAALDQTSFRLREVLHVQSLSHWAPVCVGPYSQTNTLRSGLHFLAGQIGLKPATMILHSTWQDQLHQCWTNVASVLDALDGGSLKQLVSGVVYIADHIYHGQSGPYSERNISNDNSTTSCAIDYVNAICLHEIERNGGVNPGNIDSPIATGREIGERESDDEDIIRCNDDSKGGITCPLILVSIPEMPVGAVVEVEVTTATFLAASCLPIVDASFSFPQATQQTLSAWDTGRDFSFARTTSLPSIQICVHLRKMGLTAAVMATVTASGNQLADNSMSVESSSVVDSMVSDLHRALKGDKKSPGGLAFQNRV